MEQNCSLSFLDIRKTVTTTSLLPHFTESLHLVAFLLILKVLFLNVTNAV